MMSGLFVDANNPLTPIFARNEAMIKMNKFECIINGAIPLRGVVLYKMTERSRQYSENLMSQVTLRRGCSVYRIEGESDFTPKIPPHPTPEYISQPSGESADVGGLEAFR